MRILLSNHHLEQRAGSELYCLELSTALMAAGHQVALFTFRPGGIAEEFRQRGAQVFSAADAEAIEAFDPEVLHVQHAPCLYFLGALRLRAPVVFSSLGVVPPLEAAPIVWAGVARGVAVSEEVRDALRGTPFGAAVPLSLCHNWFDDRGLERPAPARARPARRIAVVTNHLDARLKEDLDALCAARPGLEWAHLGLPHHSTEIVPETLRGFDRVVSIGRTPLLAAALQIPCLLYDIHGCDGLLSAERFSEQLRVNLSGRLTRARPSREELAHLLLDEAERLDVEALADRVWREHRLSGRAAELVSLYEEVRAGAVRLDDTTRAAYGRTGQAYAEAIDPRLHTYVTTLERVLAEERELGHTREVHLTSALARIRALEAEGEEVRSSLERALAEERELGHTREVHLTSALARIRGLEEEGEGLRSSLARAEARGAELEARLAETEARRVETESRLAGTETRVAEMEARLAWRVFLMLRTAKQWAAPPGTRRQELYNQVRQRLSDTLQGR